MIKKVGYSLYVHKSNLVELFNKLQRDEIAFIEYVIDLNICNFDIVKFDKQKKKVSLIECPTWDILNEPIVGDSYCFSMSNPKAYKVIKGSTKVYHNKWMFVAEDYKGFSITEAKRRTEIWNSIPNIKSMKSKIGNKDFWYALLRENNLPI